MYNSENITNFIRALADRRVNLHSLLLYKSDEILFQGQFFSNFFKKISDSNFNDYLKDASKAPDPLHRMYSIAKNMAAIGILLLVSDKRIRLEDHIVDYFPEYFHPVSSGSSLDPDEKSSLSPLAL